ncbi:MAG: hypothetical protein ACFE9D_03385 [Promethearchaeota archaeon]
MRDAVLIADVFIFDWWVLIDYQAGAIFLFIGYFMMALHILRGKK